MSLPDTGVRWALGVLGVVAAFALAGAAPPAPSAAPRQCCGPGVLLDEKACADGREVALNCSFKFLLDQDVQEDAWELRRDGTLTLDNTVIHDFCLARAAGGPRGRRQRDVALVCHDAEAEAQDADPRPEWWFRLASALSWLSVVCLALTLAAHVALPELRDLQGCCHMGAVASLGLALLVLAVLQEASLEGALCTTMAFLVYYWFLSAFFWLNVTSFNVWRSVVLEHKRYRERTLFACYSAVSWGAPAVLLLLLLTVHLLPEDHQLVRPQFGRNKCWFYGRVTATVWLALSFQLTFVSCTNFGFKRHGQKLTVWIALTVWVMLHDIFIFNTFTAALLTDDRATWAWFYWPLAALVGMNVVYFVWTTARLWRQYGGDASQRHCMRRRFLLSLKLFLIMGISWIFELISSAANTPGSIVWYLTDTFNAMQGVVILLVLVVCRRRVWRALHKRRPCGLRPPQDWAYPPSAVRDDCGASTDEDLDEEDEPGLGRELKDMSAGRGA